MTTETQQHPHREIISPEGVEERVLYEVVLRITLTGGGRYRLYAERSKDGDRPETDSIDIFTTEREALDTLGYHMRSYTAV